MELYYCPEIGYVCSGGWGELHYKDLVSSNLHLSVMCRLQTSIQYKVHFKSNLSSFPTYLGAGNKVILFFILHKGDQVDMTYF